MERFETSPVTYRKIKTSASLKCDKLSHPLLNMYKFMLFDFLFCYLRRKNPCSLLSLVKNFSCRGIERIYVLRKSCCTWLILFVLSFLCINRKMLLPQALTSLVLLFVLCAAVPSSTPNSVSASNRKNAASEPRAEVASIRYISSESDDERLYAFILSEYVGDDPIRQFLCDKTLASGQSRVTQVSIWASWPYSSLTHEGEEGWSVLLWKLKLTRALVVYRFYVKTLRS